LVSLWDERKKVLAAKSEKVPLLTSVFSVSSRIRIAGSTEAPQGPTRRRSRGKREKDKTRQDARDERRRLFQEAFHDNVDSIGEVDARTGSEALSVDRGDVLRDPKIPGYRHPSLAHRG